MIYFLSKYLKETSSQNVFSKFKNLSSDYKFFLKEIGGLYYDNYINLKFTPILINNFISDKFDTSLNYDEIWINVFLGEYEDDKELKIDDRILSKEEYDINSFKEWIIEFDQQVFLLPIARCIDDNSTILICIKENENYVKNSIYGFINDASNYSKPESLPLLAKSFTEFLKLIIDQNPNIEGLQEIYNEILNN